MISTKHHCKIGAIQIRHHRAIHVREHCNSVVLVNMLTMLGTLHFLGPHDTLLFLEA